MSDNISDYDGKIILIRERFWESAASNLGTFLTLSAMIGLGVYLDSEAMQWVGGVLFLISVFSRANSRALSGRMTIAQAREKLDQIEREQKGVKSPERAAQ